ncbi:hypothetical protein [Lysobacter enzymogenes]|uniref:Uncharacterized protein n=1 Tax=Lysobacter enzymogenes TaxID=69 RepID=A0A3N2RJL2_LYSEN|nr:hypothetical protein [Lysobacter enzymogenes]ROU07660.1 hypothetical protein D9T17_07710 [Lysobacter enzymogenes]
MDDPYAATRAPAPPPPPRRALFSGFVAAIYLLALFGTISSMGGHSYRFSKAGFLAEPSRTEEIEDSLRLNEKHRA